MQRLRDGFHDTLSSERGFAFLLLLAISTAFVLTGWMVITDWIALTKWLVITLIVSKTVTGVAEIVTGRSSPPSQTP